MYSTSNLVHAAFNTKAQTAAYYFSKVLLGLECLCISAILIFSFGLIVKKQWQFACVFLVYCEIILFHGLNISWFDEDKHVCEHLPVYS